MLKYKNLHPERQTQLNESKDIIRNRLSKNAGMLPRDLLDRLARYLDENVRIPAVEVYYNDPKEVPHWGEVHGFSIYLQPRTFEPWEKTGKPRLTAVVFHELVHVAGGGELDAEVFENLLFRMDEGAAPPTVADWKEFETNKGKGLWISLDLVTGIVTDNKSKVQLCRIEHGPTDEDGRVIPSEKVGY